jgi:hypothetical protein
MNSLSQGGGARMRSTLCATIGITGERGEKGGRPGG